MKSYSQNNEDLKVAEFFGGQKGNVLSIGENQGTFLSNARLLIEQGWKATLVEPSPAAFKELSKLYLGSQSVWLSDKAIGGYNGKIKFYDSGTHLNKGDTSLLSTTSEDSYKKWKGTTVFNEIEVDMITFPELLEESPYKIFEFISIDAEGNDIDILRQMNLKELGCVCICVEHNGNQSALEEIRRLCGWYGLKHEILLNAENIILGVTK